MATTRTRRRSADQIGRTALGPRPVPALLPGVTGRLPRVVREVLPNGLVVLAVRKPGTPMIEARLRIPFGNGRATARLHAARGEVLASVLTLGGPGQTREQVDADLALVGGQVGASVDSQRLMVSGSALSTGSEALFGAMATAVAGPALRAADIAIEKARLHEHLAISEAQPGAVARRHLQQRRFGDHPAGWDTPLASDVAAVTPAAVRGLHDRQVVPGGATLVLVGDFSVTATMRQVARIFGEWQSGRDAVAATPPPSIAPGPIGAFDKPGAVQSQVRLSAPAVGREHPGYPAQQLANLIYGGYFSSRLVENIREAKGYTYSASSSTQFWPERAGITVAFDTNTESTAAAVWEAFYELGRISLTPPTDAEVDSARNYSLGTLAASLATQVGLAGMLSSLAGSGLDLEWLKGYRRAVAEVTTAEVFAMARTVLAPSAFMGVVVGDLATIGAALSAVLPVELP